MREILFRGEKYLFASENPLGKRKGNGMKWEAYRSSKREEVLSYLRPREYGCTFLSATFKKKEEGGINSNGQFLNGRSGGKIKAFVHISSAGLVLPSFGLNSGEDPYLAGLKEKVRMPLSRVNTCIGIRRDVELVEGVLPPRREHVDYFLMTLESLPSRPVGRRKELTVQRAGFGDARRLFELHKGYELEEVLLDPGTYNKRQSYRHLETLIATQIVYFGTIGRFPVTKANTNALGYSWCQLGGIYTHPHYRAMGYGKTVLYRLCAETLSRGMRASLFVKKDNEPAILLYRSLGFVIKENYRISYFG